jgi:hypothetical protein
MKKIFKIDFITNILNSLRARAESEIKIFVLNFSIDMKSIYFSSIIIDIIQLIISSKNSYSTIKSILFNPRFLFSMNNVKSKKEED